MSSKRREIIGVKEICKEHHEPLTLTIRQRFECVSCMKKELDGAKDESK